MSAPCAVRRCGYAVQFSACRSLFQERATVHFFAWQLPTVRWLLLAPLPASHFVRSLMWSISDVKHVSGYVGRTRFVRCLTCRPPGAETCADQFFCFLLAVKVQYNTYRLFPTLGRSGSQSLPCRSLRSRGNRFVQFLRRVAASVHVSFATWLHGDGQFLVRPNPSYGRRRPVPNMPLADVESVPRRSRRDLCRLTVEYGDGGHCAKLDKRITVAHTVLAHFGCTLPGS